MNIIRLPAFLACALATVGLAVEPASLAVVPIQVNPSKDPADRKPAIVVRAPTKISASAKNPLDYAYEIHNMLPYEVFVEVTTADAASLNLESSEGYVHGSSGMFATPHQGTLRLLRAATQRVDQPSVGNGCSSTSATIGINLSEGQTLEEYVGWAGTIEFMVIGYRRSDGAEFCEVIEVPVEVVK